MTPDPLVRCVFGTLRPLTYTPLSDWTYVFFEFENWIEIRDILLQLFKPCYYKQWFVLQTSFFPDSSYAFYINWSVYLLNEPRLLDSTFVILTSLTNKQKRRSDCSLVTVMHCTFTKFRYWFQDKLQISYLADWFARFICWTTRPFDIYFSFQFFPVRHCISWKSSDPIALHKGSSLHPPSKLLLRSLATTHLCVGLISEPLAVTFFMSAVIENWSICRYALVAGMIAGYILCGVSFGTLTAISVDRLLALLLGLRYRQVVTLNRTYVIVVTFWVLATVCSATWFWSPLITLWCGITATCLCLVTAIFSYTKIFFNLRRHQNQVQDHVQQPNPTNQFNIARYKKAVSSAIWLQLTLVACYLSTVWCSDGFAC